MGVVISFIGFGPRRKLNLQSVLLFTCMAMLPTRAVVSADSVQKGLVAAQSRGLLEPQRPSSGSVFALQCDASVLFLGRLGGGARVLGTRPVFKPCLCPTALCDLKQVPFSGPQSAVREGDGAEKVGFSTSSMPRKSCPWERRGETCPTQRTWIARQL